MCLCLRFVGLATPRLELIEPDHEAFWPSYLQSDSPTVAAPHVRLEPEPNDFVSLRFVALGNGKRPIGLLQLLLHHRDVWDRVIDLDPAGRPRGFQILAHDNQDIPITVAAQSINLGGSMVCTLLACRMVSK